MLQVTCEVRRPLATVGGGKPAVSPASQGDGRDFDSRHALQLHSSVRVSGIPRHRPELVAIVVQCYFDPVWVVKGRGCALELSIAEGPPRRPLGPQQPGQFTAVHGQADAAALRSQVVLVPEGALTFGRSRDRGPLEVVDDIAAGRYEASTAPGPQRGGGAGGAGAPVEAAERGLRQAKAVEQVDDVAGERGLFGGARERGVAEAGGPASSQERHDDPESVRRKHRRDVSIGMDVVREPMQQDDGGTHAYVVVANGEYRGFHTLHWRHRGENPYGHEPMKLWRAQFFNSCVDNSEPPGGPMMADRSQPRRITRNV